jgi:hypothetical protein
VTPPRTPIACPGIRIAPCPVMNATDVVAVDTGRTYFVVARRPHRGCEPALRLRCGPADAFRIKGRVGVAAPTPLKSLRKVTITPGGAAATTERTAKKQR